MKINSYRLETNNLNNSCFSIHHYKTLVEAETQGFRHTYQEYFYQNKIQPKNKRLFVVFPSHLKIAG